MYLGFKFLLPFIAKWSSGGSDLGGERGYVQKRALALANMILNNNLQFLQAKGKKLQELSLSHDICKNCV